jgi:hypothetical protein
VKEVNISFRTPNKKIKLMVEGEVNDATSDEDSDNEQL